MTFYRPINDKTAIESWNTRDNAPFETIKVVPLSSTIGAEIHGADLKNLSDKQFEEIRRAIDQHLAVLIRDQGGLTREDQKAFGRRFTGKLHRHELANSSEWNVKDYDPEILGWRTGKESRHTPGDGWHPDVSCDPNPIAYSLLHVTQLPPVGGDTAFANSYLAYDSLSEPIKALLDGLTAIHDGALAWTAGYGAQPAPGKIFPQSEHPVVAIHPRTGRKFLYVNSAFTTHIVQLTRWESDALLEFLFRHVERNLAFQTRVRWHPDSLLVWDNWASQHHAVWDYFPFERWGERVSVVTDLRPSAG